MLRSLNISENFMKTNFVGKFKLSTNVFYNCITVKAKTNYDGRQDTLEVFRILCEYFCRKVIEYLHFLNSFCATVRIFILTYF